MKKLFTGAFLLLSISVFAQSEKYVKTMEEKVAAFDTTWNTDSFKDFANTFERIATTEKNQWLPYYYAALANVNVGYSMMQGNMGGGADAAKIDPLADKAEALINTADGLSKNNSEIYIVKKMIASLRMMVDPMARYMEYGPKAAEALATAQALNPENPRVYLLQGQDKFYTPEQFGGSKTEAKKLFDIAMQKFAAFKPQSNIYPTWGKSTTQHFITLANK